MRFLPKCSVFIFALMCVFLTFNSSQAARKAPPLKDMGGQTVETEYFNLVIPQDWSMPTPIQNMPQGGLTALFAPMSGDMAVTISLLKTNMSAKEMAEQTLANMKSGGINSTPIEERDGMFHTTLTGKGTGSIWFGAADGIASCVNIVGKNVDKANELLDAIKTNHQGLIPTSAN